MQHEYIQSFYYEVGKYEKLENIASTIDLNRAKFTKNTLKNLLYKYSIKNILEIGPGSGYITKFISQVIQDTKIELDILDFSETFLKSTKESVPKVNKLIIGDISNACFKHDSKYDLVIFEEALEHAISPYQAMYNINKLLHDGGKLIFSIPNTNYYKYLVNSYRLLKNKKFKYLLNSHIAELSPMGAIQLLSMTGFELLDVEYYCSRNIPFLCSFLSEEVGFLLTKSRSPEQSWDMLGKQNISYWNNIRSNP